MSSVESDDDSQNEWTSLATSYQDVLLPRFQPFYDTMAECVIKKIQSRDRLEKYRILDYGTGPGEPILTILKQLIAKQLDNVELEANDSSQGMLCVAEERLHELKNQKIPIKFSLTNDSLNKNSYDIITSSLVLPYASNQGEMLQKNFQQLKPNGLLINSHWPHPDKVPFLSIIKQVTNFMATGKRIRVSDLETDTSYSCWQEDATRKLFIGENFKIVQWITVPLPMYFPDIRTMLSLFRMADWFQCSSLYSKAEKETIRILREEFHVELQSDGSFELPSQVIVVVASK